MNKLICFAHRGASGHEPENTLLAIEKALALGAQWIEIDVHVVENELVVIHDERLERTTNGKGYVSQHSLRYLRSLDAGKGERVPFLREVFELVSHRAGINVELKGQNTATAMVSFIAEYTKTRNRSYDQVLVSSFNHHELMKVKQAQPRIKIGALMVGLPLHYAQFGEELGAYSVHLGMEFINEQFVADARHRGLKVFVFTVNHAEDIERMSTLGVDGVFTDYPELLASISG